MRLQPRRVRLRHREQVEALLDDAGRLAVARRRTRVPAGSTKRRSIPPASSASEPADQPVHALAHRRPDGRARPRRAAPRRAAAGRRCPGRRSTRRGAAAAAASATLAAAASASSSRTSTQRRSASAESSRWAWASISPGRTVRPAEVDAPACLRRRVRPAPARADRDDAAVLHAAPPRPPCRRRPACAPGRRPAAGAGALRTRPASSRGTCSAAWLIARRNRDERATTGTSRERTSSSGRGQRVPTRPYRYE